MSEYHYLTRRQFQLVANLYVPAILLTYTYGNFFSRHIVRVSNRWQRERNEYAHAMDNIGGGMVASQNAFYATRPLVDYLGGCTRIKLWYPRTMTPDAAAGVLARIGDALKAPWYRRIYDAPGIIGQWLGNTIGVGRAIQVPGIYYCSERVVSHFAPWMQIRAKASPADIDRYCTAHPDWACFGVYDPNLEAET